MVTSHILIRIHTFLNLEWLPLLLLTRPFVLLELSCCNIFIIKTWYFSGTHLRHDYYRVCPDALKNQHRPSSNKDLTTERITRGCNQNNKEDCVVDHFNGHHNHKRPIYSRCSTYRVSQLVNKILLQIRWLIVRIRYQFQGEFVFVLDTICGEGEYTHISQ